MESFGRSNDVLFLPLSTVYSLAKRYKLNYRHSIEFLSPEIHFTDALSIWSKN
jgi:hypothetical protein